ncbi:MAG TPA: hypothetical protein DCS04_00875, partial [Ruminococcaceae bacterium]|nr:hypothetical protein [Oscillospiraceae bacterium]
MSGKRSSAISSTIQYLLVFLGFALSYTFTYPQYDVLIFTRDFSGNFVNVLREALYYGNGRFLGNVLGFYFSHHFTAAIFVTAFFLTVTVLLAVLLFFGGDGKYIFPVAILIAFPAVGIIREVYSMIAAFSNYAVPFAFALLSQFVVKRIKGGGSKALYAPLALSSVCVCLFSENTTVVMLCAAVIFLIIDLFDSKKASIANAVNLISTAVGALIMFLIPRLTHTSEKLSDYRGYVTEPQALIYNALSALRSFARLAAQYLLIYIVISLLMLFVLHKAKTAKGVKIFLSAVLILFPIMSALALCFSDTASRYSIVFLALESVYMLSVFATAIISKQKRVIVSTVAAIILLGSAVAPILIVNHRGDRTFFTTFAILMCYALWLSAELKPNFAFGRCVKFVSPIVYSTISLTMLVLTAQNFAAYAYRTDYIAQKLT